MSELNLKGVLSNAYGKSGGLFSILLLIIQQTRLTRDDSLFSWRQISLIFLIGFGTIGAIFLSFYLVFPLDIFRLLLVS